MSVGESFNGQPPADLGMVFGPNMTDSGSGMASQGGDLVIRVIRINEMDDFFKS